VSANKPVKESTPSRLGNADYQWAQFDSEAYFQHYYGEPHPDDERVIRYAVEAMKHAPPIGAELDVVDVGTGPSLIPFFCALPRARQLTAWEHAEGNIAWLESELQRKEMRSQSTPLRLSRRKPGRLQRTSPRRRTLRSTSPQSTTSRRSSQKQQAKISIRTSPSASRPKITSTRCLPNRSMRSRSRQRGCPSTNSATSERLERNSRRGS
jgi:hypothetical protein